MKTKREMPLSEALEEISSTVQRLKEEGAARVNGSEVKLDDPVTLEVEMEAEKGKAEIEFEINWPVKDESTAETGKKIETKRRGKGRRLFLGAVTGIALGAAALTMMRRRRGLTEEEDEV